MDTPIFSCQFYPGKHLLKIPVCFLDNKTIPKRDVHLIEVFLHQFCISFKSWLPLRRDKNDIVAFPVCVVYNLFVPIFCVVTVFFIIKKVGCSPGSLIYSLSCYKLLPNAVHFQEYILIDLLHKVFRTWKTIYTEGMTACIHSYNPSGIKLYK